jgi:hypothetical protein
MATRRTDNTHGQKKKDRQYHGQKKKDRQYHGHKKDRQYPWPQEEGQTIPMATRRTDNTMAKRRTDNTMTKRKRTNDDLQNITQKTKD